jgi:hypothetical protein
LGAPEIVVAFQGAWKFREKGNSKKYRVKTDFAADSFLARDQTDAGNYFKNICHKI